MPAEDRRICLILNPNAGSARQSELIEEITASRGDIVLRETSASGDCRSLAIKAVEEGFDVVAAAGGDGTVNEVLNGILATDRSVRFGLVPLGTGNDLARTLGIPFDVRDALALLAVGDTRMLDIIRVETNGDIRYGINAAAGGFSGQVDEALSAELKASWGPLAYLIGAASALPSRKEYETFIAYDDGPLQAVSALGMIVANGRTVAGGKRVAPLADPTDGLLDVVVIKSGSLLNLAEVGTRLLAGNYLDSPNVYHRTARRVRITASPSMTFNIDGEMLSNDAITFAVEPAAVPLIVGYDFAPAPDVT